MSAGDWLHLIVLLQLPGGLIGFIAARDIYRRRSSQPAAPSQPAPTEQPEPDQLVTFAPEVVLAPPFGHWHPVADSGIEVRILSFDSLGTIRVRSSHTAAAYPTCTACRQAPGNDCPHFEAR